MTLGAPGVRFVPRRPVAQANRQRLRLLLRGQQWAGLVAMPDYLGGGADALSGGTRLPASPDASARGAALPPAVQSVATRACHA